MKKQSLQEGGNTESNYLELSNGSFSIFIDAPVSTKPSPTSSTTSPNSSTGKIQGRVLPQQPKQEKNENIPTSKPLIYQQKKQSSEKTKDEDWVLIQKESEGDKTMSEILQLNNKIQKMDRFKQLLSQPNVDLEQVKKLSWNGIPEESRATTWQLLMGYLPANAERRLQILTKKRKEYDDFVQQSFGKGEEGVDASIFHQIHIDIQRTHPSVKLYQFEQIQKSLERILYCWAIRHPASGYVQGINDLATPFYQVFLEDQIDLKKWNEKDDFPAQLIQNVEADCFWCLSKLLDGIQDNYTHAQPGIQRQLLRMKELIGRIDNALFQHLQAQGIEFIQFAFRWMNCLLMREMSLSNIIRMWDTYISEGPVDGFSEFHIYVCAAFLAKWSNHLRKLEFQDMIMFLQCLPTKEWTDKDVELLLSEAFMWKSLFHHAPSHFVGLQSQSSGCMNNKDVVLQVDPDLEIDTSHDDLQFQTFHSNTSTTQPPSYKTSNSPQQSFAPPPPPDSLDNNQGDTAAGGPAGNYSFWQLEYYQPYFDVDTKQISKRLLFSVFPKEKLLDLIAEKPDLYGPLWVSVTLSFLTFICSSIRGRISHAGQAYSYDFGLLSYSALVLLGYSFIVSLIMYWIMRLTGFKMEWFRLIYLFGYGLSIWFPIIIINAFPSESIRWISCLVGLGLTVWFTFRNFPQMLKAAATSQQLAESVPDDQPQISLLTRTKEWGAGTILFLIQLGLQVAIACLFLFWWLK